MEGLHTATEHLGRFGDVSDIPTDLVENRCSYLTESMLERTRRSVLHP
jgi:hypothetical protein